MKNLFVLWNPNALTSADRASLDTVTVMNLSILGTLINLAASTASSAQLRIPVRIAPDGHLNNFDRVYSSDMHDDALSSKARVHRLLDSIPISSPK